MAVKKKTSAQTITLAALALLKQRNLGRSKNLTRIYKELCEGNTSSQLG